MKKAAHKSKAVRRPNSQSKYSNTTQGGNYYRQRDLFFRTHQNAHWLLAILVASTIVYFGVSTWGKVQLVNAQLMDAETVSSAY